MSSMMPFAEVDNFNPDVPEELISGPLTNDHDYLQVYSFQEELHGKSG